ncbi:hypothetical protein IFM89_005575 [Coptis chinensis]|uniref:U1-type domain-containing protein n=1 Tax=Coptis chinensis TaxID=261450 RepID=A0A835I893_9MAGN|nr:hypothetical protein IFM89_005575 [Coptis chinensis]
MDISSLTESQQEQEQVVIQSSSYDPSYYYHSYPQYQQPPYYYQPQPDYTQNDSTPIQPPEPHPHPGLNPAAAAAVAALSQLTQFAGNMDAAERAMADRQHWEGRGPAMTMEMPPTIHHAQWLGMSLLTGPSHSNSGYICKMKLRPSARFYNQTFGYRLLLADMLLLKEINVLGSGGRPPYRGGGRRNGGPYRGGGGRGNFGQRPPRTDGSNSQFRGRGRGRGGNRRFPQRAASFQPEAAQTTEPALESEHGDVAALAVVQGETSLSVPVPPSAIGPGQAPAPGKASSTRKQPQIAWCELCRVDCTSLDILEQHKNGKKHKKNLQRFEELQKAGNPGMPSSITVPAPVLVTNPTPSPGSAPAPVAVSMPSLASTSISEVTTAPVPEMQDKPLSESKSEAIAQPENVEGGETAKSEASENIFTGVTNDESKLESDQQHDKAGQAEVAEGESTDASGNKRRFDRVDARKRSTNRKMRGGRGSKRTRTSDRPTRPVEPPKPKEVVPIICDLCNVKV